MITVYLLWQSIFSHNLLVRLYSCYTVYLYHGYFHYEQVFSISCLNNIVCETEYKY